MNDGIKFASLTALIGCLLHVSCLVGADLLSEQFTGGIPQPAAHPKPPREVLNCLVCKAVVDEVEGAIDRVSPNKKVEVGSFRLDGSGNLKQTLVPYARSQLHLSEVMDKVCEGFGDYALAHYKSTGRPTLLRLTTVDGNMNPEMANVDIMPDPETNSKFAYYCQNLVEDYEDDIISIFAKNESNPHHKVCVKTTGICPAGSVDDDDAETDSEPYNFEHEEL